MTGGFTGSPYYVAFRYGRPVLIALSFYAALLVVAAISLRRGDARSVQIVLFYAVTALAVGLGWRPVARDRASQRWSLLFQLPLDPLAFYSRLFLTSLLLTFAAMLIGASALSLAAVGFDTPVMPLWRGIFGGLYWAFLLLVVSYGISSLGSKRDFELLVLLFLLTISQGVFRFALDLPGGMVTALTFILLPYDAAVLLWEWILGNPWRLDTAQLWHMALYPLFWLAIGWHRLRSAEIA
jgi:hypothetical protein